MGAYEPLTADKKCIFCEIAAGRFNPERTFWESDEFSAFLSLHPNTEGFSCVIPKEHFGSDVLHMPDDVLQRFILAAKKTAAILEAHFPDVGRVGLIMEGTGIDHAHIKLAPMHGTEHMKRGEWKQILSGKNLWFDRYEGYISSASGPEANPEHLRKLAERLRRSSDTLKT